MKRLLALFLILTLSLGISAAFSEAPRQRTLLIGESYSFSSKAKANYVSSAPDIASVDAVGQVTALKEGESLISLNAEGKTLECRITVKTEAQTPPLVQAGIDFALKEWENSLGRSIGKSNKYTKWYCGKECAFGWCGAFASYCLFKAGLPMEYWRESLFQSDGAPHAVKEADVLKLLRGYTNMDRVSRIPRPGYLVIYGKKNGYATLHTGLVTAVTPKGEGVYALETAEGNMSSRIKRYSFLYDSRAAQDNNCQSLPEEAQTQKDVFQYAPHAEGWYVNTFCQTWH